MQNAVSTDNRKGGLDVLKAICCFLIVCIHIEFPHPLNHIVTPLARIAVPIFFMITGYFHTQTIERGKTTIQLKRTLQLLLIANLFYLVFWVAYQLITKQSILSYLRGLLNKRTLFHFFILNETPLALHLWYLGALLYALAILWLFEKKCSWKRLYPLIPILLLINVVLGQYADVLFGRVISFVWTRNFLFLGIPCVLLGDLFYHTKHKIKNSHLALMCALFTVTTVAEEYLLEMAGSQSPRDLYISSIFLAISAFGLATNIQTTQGNISKKVAYVGSRLSLGIYIIHPFFIIILNFAASLLGQWCKPIEQIYSYVGPILVLVVSVVVVFVSQWLKKELLTK